MCSDYLINSNSCYIDNFELVAQVFARGLVMGIIIGTVVGILILFAKK